jgi:cysteine desulfurase/selenocysteine lyase
MGREIVKDSVAELPLWQRYADQFPVRDNLLYLNHAAVAPLPRVTADALKHLAEDSLQYGSLHYAEWLAVYEGLRAAAARLINADRSEIALMKNTSEGIATIAMGLDWQPGDRMVGFKEEFPANVYPWKRLEAKGIEVTWLSVYDSLECIDEACRGARLLSVSYVQFLSGHRVSLQEIGEICRRNRCIY